MSEIREKAPLPETENLKRLLREERDMTSSSRKLDTSDADSIVRDRLEAMKPAGAEMLDSDGKDLHDTNSNLEKYSEAEQVKLLTEYLENCKEIKFENWVELPLSERLKVFQTIENKAAEIAGRPALQVVAVALPSQTRGSMSWSDKRISINENLLSSNNTAVLKQGVKTLLHEGRHAYQFQNVRGIRREPNTEKYESWKENITGDGYFDPARYGFRMYSMQPVEVDARVFSEDIVSKLKF